MIIITNYKKVIKVIQYNNIFVNLIPFMSYISNLGVSFDDIPTNQLNNKIKLLSLSSLKS